MYHQISTAPKLHTNNAGWKRCSWSNHQTVLERACQYNGIDSTLESGKAAGADADMPHL